ncbi:MAG: hypothetical protein PWR03_1398 [Tenuifilum sp.]|uniref:type I restriction enzyme HsdR N-terminal domain-containing protein n=1 Tax=Tenuifilum sp. TaxID=2760880 RepID=UPI0024AA9BE6|nr:type I restriction enzyme HsdR N-terminal domain-containing protein [Tenuifilum sp.]MDI3527215.1 hypothetical protein [Tenuifilum sp.]
MSNSLNNKLNLPSYQFRIKKQNGNRLIFDIVRKRFIALTPEEWVRQHIIHYLVYDLNVPIGLIGVEVGFNYNKVNHRADIVVYNREGFPLMIVECKAPSVEISQDVVDQICRYNYILQAEYLLISNGIKHIVLQVDTENKWKVLDNFPNLTIKIK